MVLTSVILWYFHSPNPKTMAEYVSFSSRIFNFLSILEKIAVVVALLGIGFKYLHLAGGNEMLMLGLSGLAGVYFMFAYKPPEKTDQEEKPGFATLLIATILPKVSWIACSVLTIGVLFGVLNLSGSAEMLMIGVAAG